MFTGIVEATGEVAAVTDDAVRSIVVACPAIEGLKAGDSVAVAGVCLTVVNTTRTGFEVQVIPETAARTTLGGVAAGDRVNLERPLAAAGRFDGHIVQGHVDGVGSVRSVAGGEDTRIWIDASKDLMRYAVEKGSVAVDGVSLTVSSVDPQGFEVALIPHTLAVTTLGALAAGDPVNVEADVVAKYIDRLLEGRR